MSKLTIVTNGKITAVFFQENKNLTLEYYKVDGDLIAQKAITKADGNNAYRKLIKSGYKTVARVARA